MSSKKIFQIIVPVVLVLAIAGIFAKSWFRGNQTSKIQETIAEWRQTKWPQEIRETEEKVRERQSVNDTIGAVTIDLKPYVNAKLTEAPVGWKGQNANNLSELPSGTNIFGGVPFHVEGSIQLMGKWLHRYKKVYPSKVGDILIGKPCKNLYVLHGAANARDNAFGQVIAKIVVHYEDGTTRDLNIVAGDHVFDWWSPIYKTGIDKRMRQTAPGTELAWTGSSPHLKQWSPDFALTLYKSTFKNPQPNVPISKLDYVSTLTDACPFLVGLTIE